MIKKTEKSKTAKKQSALNPRLSVWDRDGALRATFARIGARVMTGGDMSAGVRYAASFTDSATRQELPPLDWDACDLNTLRTYAVHGYDFRVRAMALAEIEKRVGGVYRELYNAIDETVRESAEHYGLPNFSGRIHAAYIKVRESAEELAE